MSGVNRSSGADGARAIRNTLGLLPLVAMSAALAGPAMAQDAQNEIVLDTVTVQGGSSGNALKSDTSRGTAGRLPGAVKDIPQTVNVVTKELIEQQKVTTLEQALKNVPGVTMRAGEGGGGMAGDQFVIRGFEAKGDIYVDGLRDPSVRVRDAFAYEDVQVLKGGSSQTFGSGTTGGAINTRLKKAHLGDETNIDASVGLGPLARTVVDWNKQLTDTSALRVVGMGNLQSLVERDNMHRNAAGALITTSTGIGTDLQWDLSYLYQHSNLRPDGGVPLVANGTASVTNPSLPVTQFGVPRSVFYGKSQDKDISNSHALTSNLKWETNDWFTLYNDTRFSYDNRDFSYSIANPPAGAALAAFFAGNRNVNLGGYGGGNPTYKQETYALQNITTGVAKFDTGGLRHEFVGGIDVYYASNHRDNYPLVGAKTVANIYNPGLTFNDSGYSIGTTPSQTRDGNGTAVGVFASDRVWLTPELSLLAGVRFDTVSSNFRSVTGGVATTASDTTSFWSPKASVIWEPTQDQSYYVTWSSSASAVPGQFVANDINSLNAAQPNRTPERNNVYEVGGKVSVLDGRLGLTGALFQVDKSNSVFTDPATGTLTASGENHRVRGFEVGVTGEITPAWQATLAYAFIDSRIMSSTATPSTVGNKVPFASQNSVSLWTSYELSRHLNMTGKLQVGGGVTYADGYFLSSANTSMVPSSFSLDMFASYQFEKFRVSLNAYNLTNNLNYVSGQGSRAVVAPGRSFVLSAGITF